jgi:hypothetical protein
MLSLVLKLLTNKSSNNHKLKQNPTLTISQMLTLNQNADAKPNTDSKSSNSMDNKPLSGMDKTLASTNTGNKTATATGGVSAGASPQSVLAIALGAFSVFGVVFYA